MGTSIQSGHGTVFLLIDQTGTNNESSALSYGRRKMESHLQSRLIASFRTGFPVRWNAVSFFP